MQDDWFSILGETGNIMDSFKKLENKIAPELIKVQQNADKVSPELKAMLDKDMVNLDAQKAVMEAKIKQVREMQEKSNIKKK